MMHTAIHSHICTCTIYTITSSTPPAETTTYDEKIHIIQIDGMVAIIQIVQIYQIAE